MGDRPLERVVLTGCRCWESRSCSPAWSGALQPGCTPQPPAGGHALRLVSERIHCFCARRPTSRPLMYTRLQPGVFSQVGRRVMMPGDVVASLAWLAFDIPWLLAYVLLLHRMLAGARYASR